MLGKEILKQRLVLSLSITELAKLTSTSTDLISRLESGERKFITNDNFHKLNTVLNLDDYSEYVYDITNEILAEKVRNARLAKNLTQQDLAILCGYKSKASICHLEIGYYSKILYSTFLRLQEVLNLDEDEFKPFIQKREIDKGRIIIQNRILLQKLVTEKRESLKLSKTVLAKMAGVTTNTVTKLELHPDKNIQYAKVMKIIKVLEFTEEEILACFKNLEEEDIELYFKDKIKKK